MKNVVKALGLGVALLASPANANSESFAAPNTGELPAYLQCVPYAREVSGIQIYGDAHTWWEQAEGKYKRGNKPKVGAVMAFKDTERMQLGHVAAVVKIIDKRTVLLDHANWSPINGRRGQIERGVKAVDVSKQNDWSEVRVWYHPLQALGTTAWPVHGFIYNDKGKVKQPKLQRAVEQRPVERVPVQPVQVAERQAPSRDFANAFGSMIAAKPVAKPQVSLPPIQRTVQSQPVQQRTSPPSIQRRVASAPQASDPYAAVLAKYD